MMERAPTTILTSLLLGVVCLLAGCGLENRTDSGGTFNTGGDRAAISLAAFSEVVHPVLTANCSGCHGSIQAPTFALANAQSAWSVMDASGLASSLDAASSRVVIKGGTAHGGCTACNSTTAGQIRDGISEWNRRVNEGTTGGPPPVGANRIVLASVNVSVPVGSTTPVPVTFSLDQVGIAGGSIRLRIARFGTAFLLDRIQVVAANSAVQIEDVLPIADGTLLASSAAWRGVRTVVGTQRSVTVTTDALLLGVPSITQLGLSILKINTASARTCSTTSASTFAATVQPIITSRCIGCHGAGGSGSGVMSLASGACEAFLERSVPGAFSKSATVGMPRFQFFNHPATTLTDVEVGRFTTWYFGANP